MVKNLPCNEEDTGLIPGGGKKTKPTHATTRESMPRNKRSRVLQLRPGAAK